MGFGEGIRDVASRGDDDGPVEGGPQPGDVSVPEESPSLAYDGEVIHIALPCLYGALGHVRRTISPSTPQLANTMPVRSMHRSFDSHDIHFIVKKSSCKKWETKRSSVHSNALNKCNAKTKFH